MKAFLIAIVLAVLFMAGSVFALQPSPRQRQLARLRHRAILGGLRVHVQAGTSEVQYTLPWRVADLDRPQAPDLVASRDAAGAWQIDVRAGPADAVLRAQLERLPAAVARVVAGVDGVIAHWSEQGTEADVTRIAEVLVRVRADCAPALSST